MASLRTRKRKDGSDYYAVLYRLAGKQTSTSFEDFASAAKFCDLANKVGPANALLTLRRDTTASTLTVEQWLTHHIDHLTGVDLNTVEKYRAYLRNDIAEPLGAMPLAALTREHIAQWVKGMQEPNDMGWTPSAKTIANKHGFLAGALNWAVAADHIPANPCTGIRLPRDDDAHEMLFLSREQFALLRDSVTEYWQPLVEFLVASGCRWGEAVALRPSDVDRKAATVRIARSWKYGNGGYRLGAPKTPKSKRTINIPTSVLDKLDYSHEWLFVNRTGGPVRAQGFSARVWAPALERAWPSLDANGAPVKDKSQILRPRIHDLRHTCAWTADAAGPDGEPRASCRSMGRALVRLVQLVILLLVQLVILLLVQLVFLPLGEPGESLADRRRGQLRLPGPGTVGGQIGLDRCRAERLGRPPGELAHHIRRQQVLRRQGVLVGERRDNGAYRCQPSRRDRVPFRPAVRGRGAVGQGERGPRQVRLGLGPGPVDGPLPLRRVPARAPAPESLELGEVMLGSRHGACGLHDRRVGQHPAR